MSNTEYLAALTELTKAQAEIIDRLFTELLQFRTVEEMETAEIQRIKEAGDIGRSIWND